MLLGLADGWVALAYILSLLCSLLCVVYGVINWNKGDEPVREEDRHWAEEEDKISEEL